MNRLQTHIVLTTVIALALCETAHADNVYKCKGASGEMIYQSDPCPAGATPIARGRYDRQPDDPSNNIEAVNEAAADNAKRENQRRAANAAAQVDTPNEPPQQSEYERQREARRAQIEAGSYRSRIGDSGPPKVNGYSQQPTSSAQMDMPIARHATTHPSEPTDCRTNAGNVTCYDDHSNISFGHTDPAGNTDVISADGTSTRLSSDTCIKDQYGKCQ